MNGRDMKNPTHLSWAGRAFLGLLLAGLGACGGGSNDQGAVPAPPPTAQSAPVPPPMATPGDGWQGRYVGTVTIGDVRYFGDAMLTADGLIRLYLGGPYDDDGVLPLTVPAGSAQLVGTLHGQTNRITGDGLVFGQEIIRRSSQNSRSAATRSSALTQRECCSSRARAQAVRATVNCGRIWTGRSMSTMCP